MFDSPYRIFSTILIGMIVTVFFAAGVGHSHVTDESPTLAEGAMPTLKFFYYDSRNIEWVVSAEGDAFDRHMAANVESARLFQSLTEAAYAPSDVQKVQTQMARWIDQERQRFDTGARNTVRFRKAEGIVAYLRAHDFEVQRLVRALLTRTGADSVELVAVHLVDNAGVSSYKLKVVLPNDTIDIGKQGFNVVHSSPDVTYTGVAYALALALYEVHEVINQEADGGEPGDELEVEPLPPPMETGSTTRPGAPVRWEPTRQGDAPTGVERSVLYNP